MHFRQKKNDARWNLRCKNNVGQESGKYMGKSTQTFTEKKHNVYYGEVKIQEAKIKGHNSRSE